MKLKLGLLAIVIVITAFAAVNASADTLTADGFWNYFGWVDGPNTWATPTFDFTTSSNTTIQVVDGGVTGDQFEVWVNDALAMTTSGGTSGDDLGLWEDAAWASDSYAKGSFSLDSGTYTIKIKNIEIAPGFTAGGAYMRALATPASTSVPEPTSLIYFGMPALMLGINKLRKLRK